MRSEFVHIDDDEAFLMGPINGPIDQDDPRARFLVCRTDESMEAGYIILEEVVGGLQAAFIAGVRQAHPEIELPGPDDPPLDLHSVNVQDEIMKDFVVGIGTLAAVFVGAAVLVWKLFRRR